MSPAPAPQRRLRALIYNRVSADPSGRRISTASQDTENRASCAQQGWEVVATITDDDRSASRFATRTREGYQHVLQALDGQLHGRIDVLVTWESSRGERRLDGYVNLRDRLERNNVLLAYKGRVFDMAEGDDRFITGLDALLDEREAERARERTLRSHRDSARRGTPRGVTPYGYQRLYDSQSGRMQAQTIHPQTGLVVEEIAARIIRGDTLYGIAKDLNRRRVPTPREHRDREKGLESSRAGWSSSMLRNIMRKQSLMGVRTHKGIATGEATWPALVDPADWAAVQRVLADPFRARTNGGQEVRHLLSGLATCAVCEGKLRPQTHRGAPMYVCAGTVPTASKGHVHRSRDGLDAMVIKRVIEELEDETLFQRAAEAARGDTGRAADIDRRLAGLKARMAEHEKAARDVHGPGSAVVFGIIADLAEEIAAVEAERDSVSGLPPVVWEAAGSSARTTWNRHADDLPWQRQLVRALVRVRVHRVSRPGMRGFDESTVEITRAWVEEDRWTGRG